MRRDKVPKRPAGDNLRAVSLQVELNPIEKDALPVSVIQVLPLGEVQIRDSRENFYVTDVSVVSILSHFGEQSVDLMIDYDHGAYYGDNSVAAGWGEKMWAIVPNDLHDRVEPFIRKYGDRVGLILSEDEADWGIYVFVRWTAEAAEKIEKREYRYVSPVVFFSYTGVAEYLWNAAIVNMPAIDGMDALAASMMPAERPEEIQEDDVENPAESSAAGIAPPDDGAAGEPISPNPEKEDDMSLKAFAAAFYPDVDTEAEDFSEETFTETFTAEFEALRETASQHEALAAEFEQVKAERDEVAANLETVTAERDALQAVADEAEDARRKANISAAIESGKLAESQRPWAEENYEAFESLLESLGDHPLGPPQGKTVEVDEEGDDGLDLQIDTRAEKIRAYADENEVSFRDAYVALSKAGQI